jgi:hypothetical protein
MEVPAFGHCGIQSSNPINTLYSDLRTHMIGADWEGLGLHLAKVAGYYGTLVCASFQSQ